MKMIKQGAEAKIFLDKKDNQNVIIKDRIKKEYRIKEIDDKIRRLRTTQEYNLLSEAKRANVPTPTILGLDKQNHKIIMEYVNGTRIKELLFELDKKKIEEVSFKIGELIGKLHSAGIIHGDLTTSNMILSNEDIYFIDFGLGFFSKKIEDQGTDLRLLYEALKSTHFKIIETCWKKIIEGYVKEYTKANQVLEKIEEIKKRARYVKR